MGTFWDYLGIGNSSADKAHDTAAKAMELNAQNIESLSKSLGVDRQYYDNIANKDEREQALADVEALANRQEKKVKRSMANLGNSAIAQFEAAKAGANTRDETYAGAIQQSRSRKDAAKEKSLALKQQQTELASKAAQSKIQEAQENAGFGRDYSKDVATAKVKTAEDARNTAYENETNVNAALNKQAQERYARELAPFLLEQGNEIALQNKLKEMAIMDARLEGIAAQAEKILQEKGTPAYKRFIAARLGQVYDGGLVTEMFDKITDNFTGRGGGN